MNSAFLSDVFDKSIKTYLEFKNRPESLEFNDFFVVVIRQLCLIYGEEAVIVPYQEKNEKLFNENITKYGFELDRVLDFESQFNKSYEESINQNKNSYFVSIEKNIIDMFFLKYKVEVVSDITQANFYNLLYTIDNPNPLFISYNFLNSANPKELESYYKDEFEKHKKVIFEKKKEILNLDIYPIFGVSVEKVHDMKAEELDKINKSIYEYFKIDENAINKEFLLEKAVENYKRNNEKITSGNGYVDILLILSVIVTIGLLATIIVYLVN